MQGDNRSPRWRSPGDGWSPRGRGRSSGRATITSSYRFPHQTSPRYRHDVGGNPYRSPYGASPYGNHRGFEPRGYHGHGKDQFQRFSPGFSPGGRQRSRGHSRQSFESAGIDNWISPEMWGDPWNSLKLKLDSSLQFSADPSEKFVAQPQTRVVVPSSEDILDSSQSQPPAVSMPPSESVQEKNEKNLSDDSSSPSDNSSRADAAVIEST